MSAHMRAHMRAYMGARDDSGADTHSGSQQAKPSHGSHLYGFDV